VLGRQEEEEEEEERGPGRNEVLVRLNSWSNA
jgi:hypothetical protein